MAADPSHLSATRPGEQDCFRSLFEFLPIGAYRSLPGGSMLRANPALVQLNGYDTEAELLAAMTDIAGEWYLESHRRDEFRHRIERDGFVRGFVYEVRRHKTRERIWIHENAHVVRGDDGQVLFYEGTIEDITAQRAAAHALRDSEIRWKLALDAVGDGVWDWDLTSGVETLSARCREMHGLRDGSGSHELLDAMTHPQDVPQMRHDRDQHLRGLTPAYVNEHRVRAPDGSWRWILSRGLVIARDAHGRPLRMIGTHTDITARKRAEALRRERDAAEASARAMTEFLSRVSHELRTPLNAILGFAQLLGADARKQPHQAAWIDETRKAGQHLLALVEDVLDLSGARSGQLQVSVQTFPLQAVVDECLAMLAPEAGRRGIALKFGGTPVGVKADRLRTKQIVANLLSNAVKYNRPEGRVDLACVSDGVQVRLTVADTGLGLEPSELRRLFQPFERLGAQAPDTPGAGLGLALSRELARGMGGDIVAASTPGQGSEFTLLLPAA